MMVVWVSKRLEECLEKVKYPSKIHRKKFLAEGAFPIVSQEQDFVNGYWDDEQDVFRANKPIIIFGDHTKVLKYVDFDFVLGADGVKILQTKDFLYPKYFYYFLNAFPVKALGYARHYRLLKELKIHYPTSLPEQKRIVAILDKAFAGINAALANTEKNLANARELFESYLNAVFTQKGDGWVEKTLGEYSTSISTGPFGSLLHKSDYVSTGVPLVNPINIVGRNIVPNSSKLIDAETKKRLQGYVLHQGDIVIARRGEIGRCAVIDSEHDGWVCGTGCFFMQPLPSVNPHFLANLIRSQGYREKLEKVATGATMKNLSNKTLSNLSVSIPNFEKQAEIIAKFDEFAGETHRLEAIYQQKLKALTELKQSILQKAFAGELTALPEKTLEEAVA